MCLREMEKMRKEGKAEPAFLAAAEFTANRKLRLLDDVEVRAAAPVLAAASPFPALIQPVRARSRETARPPQESLEKRLNYGALRTDFLSRCL